MGGIRNAAAETAGLRRQLDHAEQARTKLLPELEQLLGDIAADWPAAGLSNEQMQSLEFIFVDTAEIRYRLAAKLTQQADRNRLLGRNVNQLRDFVGLAEKPESISNQYFLPEESRFTALADWAAQSLVLLCENDHRGIGKRTSDLAFGAAEAAERLITQPFISARQPEAWQAVATRAACAHRFSFAVVAQTPEDQQPKVVRLNELALEHTFILLSARNLPVQSATSFYRLTVQAVQHLQLARNAEELRTSWVLSDGLPDFARALALWASPRLVEKHDELARDLFRRVCVPPLSRRTFDLQMSCMLTLLDMAIASCARAERVNLIISAQQLWKDGYCEWLSISPRWEGIAGRLALAVAGDAVARADLISDESFAYSHCRRLLGASPTTPAVATDSLT
jgi:hypothetical protein